MYGNKQIDSTGVKFAVFKRLTSIGSNGIQTHNHLVSPVWLNGGVFGHELSGCGFESCYCHLNFRYGACFKQGIPCHLGKL